MRKSYYVACVRMKQNSLKIIKNTVWALTINHIYAKI